MTRWGILGTGSMAAAFVRDLAGLPDARVQAVGSRDSSSAAKFAQGLGIARWYGSYQELWADREVDVVYIATLNPTHHDLCLRALDAGKAVLCEKPFTINAGQARAVADRARERGLFCMEAMWIRFIPGIIRLKELVQEGAIGVPRMLAANIGYPFVADKTGRQFDSTQGGGALLDLGVYPLSLASYLFGRSESVLGRATLAQTGVDDMEAIVLAYPGGRLAVLTVSLDTASPNEAVVMGTTGQIRLQEPFYRPHRLTLRSAGRIAAGVRSGGGRLAKLKNSPFFQKLTQRFAGVTALLRPGSKSIFVPYTGNGYHYEASEVTRCLRAGLKESPIMPLAESIGVLETMDELRRQWGVHFPGDVDAARGRD